MDPEFKKWLRGIPVSKMADPQGFFDNTKYLIWYLIRPLHPYVRNVMMRLGLGRLYKKYQPDGGRQRFLLGVLAPGVTPEDLVTHLVIKGYGRQLVALKDQGELVSMRYSPTFKHQYHIRIFYDGEVRGHYEYTVEDHPLRHQRQQGFEEHRSYFMKLLDGYITPSEEKDEKK